VGYQTFSTKPKSLTKAEDVGPGQIGLSHLDPALFAQMQRVGLHNHSGTGSRRVKLQDLEGEWGKNGFLMYSLDGTKRYRIRIGNDGVLTSTEV
jgi:hypothetical protein